LKEYEEALYFLNLLNEILEDTDLDLLLNIGFCYNMQNNIEISRIFYKKVKKIDKVFLEQRI
jgi:tetratricopeptide (TPR) repeat protein